MTTNTDYKQIDARDIGLDRSDITSQGQIELPDKGFRKDVDDDYAQLKRAPDASSPSISKIDTIKQKKHDAGIKLRKALHISKPSDDIESSSSPILANTADEQDHSRLDNTNTDPEKHTLKELIHDPIDTVKSKANKKGEKEVAANIAAKEIPHGQDVDLVKAASAVDRARSEREKLLAVQNLSELLKLRQSTFVRWTLDRHVSKVRVLPKNTVTKKPQTEFQKKDAQGKIVVDWEAYVYHVSLIKSFKELITLLICVAVIILCSSLWRTVHWLWIRPTNTVQRNHHAQFRAYSHRDITIPGVHHDHSTSLPLGATCGNVQVFGNLHGIVVLQFAATRPRK